MTVNPKTTNGVADAQNKTTKSVHSADYIAGWLSAMRFAAEIADSFTGYTVYPFGGGKPYFESSTGGADIANTIRANMGNVR